MFPLARFGWGRGASGGGAIVSLLLSGLQWLRSFTPPTTLKDQTENALDANLVQSTCLTLAGDEGFEFVGSAVASYDGTTTLSDVGGGFWSCTAGTLWNVVLDDGTAYPCSEGGGSKLYNSTYGNKPANLYVGASGEAGAWSGLQDDYHYNILNGYALYQKGGSLDIYIPYRDDIDGNPMVPSVTPPSGYTLTANRPATGIHNGALTSFQQEASSEPTLGASELYFTGGSPNVVTWADILAWVSYSDDYTWLKFTTDGTSCYLTDSVIIDISGDEDTYDKLVAWKGGGACGGGTSPFS